MKRSAGVMLTVSEWEGVCKGLFLERFWHGSCFIQRGADLLPIVSECGEGGVQGTFFGRFCHSRLMKRSAGVMLTVSEWEGVCKGLFLGTLLPRQLFHPERC